MKDIRKEIATRNYHITKRPLYFLYRFVMKIVSRKYNAHYEIIDDINDCKGPCFLIFNHLSRLDHIYAMEAAYPRRVNMVCAYNEFFRSHLHFAFKHNNVLPKKQYCNDILGTRIISKMIKKGACIAFAPEGLATNDGMNKPIVPGTAHMLKHYKVPVYFLCLRGEHLQNTKACLDERYGATFATISLLFSKEDLERLTIEQIDRKINESFKHDEYAWQKEKHIKWTTNGRMAYHLEQILYRCPKCGTEFKMIGEGDTIKCSNCGNGAKIDEYYDFHPFDDNCVIPDTISDWVKEERINIIKEIRKDKNYSYSEKVKIGKLPNDHYLKHYEVCEIVGEGILTIDHTGLRYKDNQNSNNDFDINFNNVYTLGTVLDASYFSIYIDGEFNAIYPESKTMMKWNLLVEEMHRLHVNLYKNFPWNDYMYENIN